jgi:hypothetical protein
MVSFPSNQSNIPIKNKGENAKKINSHLSTLEVISVHFAILCPRSEERSEGRGTLQSGFHQTFAPLSHLAAKVGKNSTTKSLF